MIRILFGYFTLITWLCVNHSYASQSYNLGNGKLVRRHFGVQQGLPSSETYHVFQDKKGYIWIATDRGVVRYNGIELKKFDRRNGLLDPVVFKCVEDPKGNIWFVSFSGLLCYWNGHAIVPYKYNHLIKKYLGDFQSSYKTLVIGKDGTIYFGLTSKGSIRITPNGRLIDYHKAVAPVNTIFVKQIEDQLFVSNLSDARKYRVAKKPVYSLLNAKKKLLLHTIGNIRLASSQYQDDPYLLADFWVVNLRDTSRRVFNPGLIGMNVDRQFIWLCQFSKGVRCYSKDDFGRVDRYTTYFEDYSVSSVLQDHQGGYWFSTLENGVYYIPNIRIQNWSKSEGMKLSEIYSITGNRHELVIGTKKGYAIFQKNSSHFYPVNAYFTPNTIFSEQGKLHASGFQKGVRGKSGVYRFHKPFPHFFDIHALNRVDGGVISVSGPVIKFESDRSELIDTIANIQVAKGFNFVYAIDGVDKSTYYIGGISGLRKMIHGKIQRLDVSDPRYHVRVDDIEYVPGKGLFVATRGNGVLLVLKDRVIAQFDERSGLLDNYITDLHVDSNGDMYVSSYKGISRIRKLQNGTWEIRNLNHKMGMISSECLSIYVDDFSVWCGTKSGLVQIPKNCFDQKKVGNSLFLEAVLQGKNKLLMQKSFSFHEGEPLVELRIRNLNYQLGEKMTYRYRFSPSQNWIVSSSPRILLQYPTSGKYELEIEQMDLFGNWTQAKKLLSIAIQAPFYKRWYFFLGLSIIAVWLVYLSFRIRLKAVNNKFKLQKQVNELEQKALSAQMNPHFIFNSLNSIQSFLMYEENEKAEKYLLKFSKLIRSILSNSRETFIPVAQEIELLTNYIELEQMRFQSRFDYRIENLLKGSADHVMMPPMMIQPLVENAILHGLTKRAQGGSLIVRFELVNDHIRVTVEDNGVGMGAEQNRVSEGHRSFGTQITRERMEIYEKNFNQQFEWRIEPLSEDEKFPGTRVILTIPILKKID